MDTPLEKAIEVTERRLEMMREKNPEAAFHCPKCGKYFEQLGNYAWLKMCGKCYRKIKTQELKAHVANLLGATVTDIEVEEADPLWLHDQEKPVIKQITLKMPDGKEIKLNKEQEVHYL